MVQQIITHLEELQTKLIFKSNIEIKNKTKHVFLLKKDCRERGSYIIPNTCWQLQFFSR
jgi:hypothetical protein